MNDRQGVWMARVARSLFLYFVLVFWACASAAEEPSGGRIVIGNSVIFTPSMVNEKPSLLRALGVSSADWTPDVRSVELIEDLLVDYLIAQGQSKIVSKYSTYRRQYIGFTVNGKRWILVNGVCYADAGKEWERGIVLLFDAGECNFSVRYNVEGGYLENLDVVPSW